MEKIERLRQELREWEYREEQAKKQYALSAHLPYIQQEKDSLEKRIKFKEKIYNVLNTK